MAKNEHGAASRRTTYSFISVALVLGSLGGGSLIARAADITAARPSVQFGPIRFGMNVAEIQAAVPGANWEISSKSQFTGRPFGLRAVDALDYGGWRMTIGVRDEKYDRHIELTSRRAEPDAAACAQAALTLFAALEGSAGSLQARQDPYGEAVTFGNGSTASFNAFDAKSGRVSRKALARGKVQRMGLTTQRESERLEVKGQVSFDATAPANCSANVIAIGWSERPPLEVMPYDAKRVVGQMSIGDKHRLASTLNFNSDAVGVSQQCEVSRQSGKVLLCRSSGDPAIDPALVNVAGRYAGAMRFDMSGLDRDDPQTVLVDIPVRVARSDVRTVGQPATLLQSSDIEFTASPKPKDLQQAFPFRALRGGVGAQVDSICEVQADGSLVCRTAAVRQSDAGTAFAVDFEQATQKLLPLFQAGPTLKNGSPSAGAIFALGLQFRLAE